MIDTFVALFPFDVDYYYSKLRISVINLCFGGCRLKFLEFLVLPPSTGFQTHKYDGQRALPLPQAMRKKEEKQQDTGRVIGSKMGSAASFL